MKGGCSMKRKKASVLLSCIMTTVLFTGCTITVSPTTPDSASESTVQSDIEGLSNHSSSDSASSKPTASPDTQSQEASGSSSAENKEYTDLSFLTEEQQQLYQTACEISFGLYGMGSNLMYSWGYRPASDSEGNLEIVMENYTLYDVAYDDFSDQIHQIFTDNCLATTDYTAKFIDYHGSLAVDTWMTNDLIEGTTRQVLEDAPDTYRLIRSTEDEMAFTLISHYDRDWNVSADMNVFTVEYPIRMVNTASGWRIDEFHTTMYG